MLVSPCLPTVFPGNVGAVPQVKSVSLSEDDRSASARAYSRAAQVMTACLEMVVPGLIGYYIDQKVGTRVVGTIVGFALGLTMGIWHLVKMTESRSGSSNRSDDSANQDGSSQDG